MNQNDVAQWVRAARKSRGWSQEALGAAVGVGKANVSHWETGKHDPSFLQLLRIRDVTGYPLQEVVGPADWPLPQVLLDSLRRLSPDARTQVERGLVALLAAVQNDGEGSADDLGSSKRPPLAA